jgi:mRNA interferase RelE/StbE
MASYRLEFRTSVARDLRRIPARDVQRILARIDTLKENPRPPGCEKMFAQERYRIRQGNYRIIYEISDAGPIVIVVRVGHRREVYESR